MRERFAQPAAAGRSSLIFPLKRSTMMKNCVDALYPLLWQRQYDPEKYQRNLAFGLRYARDWDDPGIEKPGARGIDPEMIKKEF
jgi:hypothetical protein